METDEFSDPIELQKALDELIGKHQLAKAVLRRRLRIQEGLRDSVDYVVDRWEYLRSSGSDLLADYWENYRRCREQVLERLGTIQGTITEIRVLIILDGNTFGGSSGIEIVAISDDEQSRTIHLGYFEDSTLSKEFATELGLSIGITHKILFVYDDD